MLFWNTKRPKGSGEDLDEFIARRMREIDEEERLRKAGTVKVVKKKGFVESELIREGYWPEDDTHHDVIRAALITKGVTVGIYIASILMVLRIWQSQYYLFNYPANDAYDMTFYSNETIHFWSGTLLLFIPTTLCLLYKLFRRHVPRFMELDWYKKAPEEKELSPLEKKINFYMDYYLLFAVIMLNAYGRLLTIYHTTETLWDLVYVHNDDREPLFYSWEVFLLKCTGLWLNLEVSYYAKFWCCIKFIINESLHVPEPVPDYWNLRTGIAMDWFGKMIVQPMQTAELTFFSECSPENPGNVEVLFRILRKEGPEKARDEFLRLYKDFVKEYNDQMHEIQWQAVRAYGRTRPLYAGDWPIYWGTRYSPYPPNYIQAMKEGRL